MTIREADRSASAVCIVTGGASGMGLAVVERLVGLGWNVMVVDWSNGHEDDLSQRFGSKVMFSQANVAVYDELAQAFIKTWETWGRLDVLFSNAGIGDRVDFYAQAPEREDGAPMAPSTTVIDVDLVAAAYGAYLALHYFRKQPGIKRKIIFTSSMCGIYSGDIVPLYTAAKHGVVGLTYSLGRMLRAKKEDITVNCLCPGLVLTGMTGWAKSCPPDRVTPADTIVGAFETFLNDDTRTAQAAECSGKNVYYRSIPEYSDSSAEYIMDGKDEGSLRAHLREIGAQPHIRKPELVKE